MSNGGVTYIRDHVLGLESSITFGFQTIGQVILDELSHTATDKSLQAKKMSSGCKADRRTKEVIPLNHASEKMCLLPSCQAIILSYHRYYTQTASDLKNGS